ncbi:MAG: sulfur carrier protein ThiS [Euryhalocaulis sp.]|uniref:sulfur carrier protein ThiS n=1 Tax=Euryhalocaulis sp. TaxID=2744307 RepID=UPI0017DA1336|nr:sulfur carrier protein ThiS [Euryhalocaulis sp.]MBA4800226.1 sulfur carrier protein ThiS [Euryhalocaulis sp.]
MQIMLNGDSSDVPDGLNVEGLLAHLEIPLRKVAVERNLEIVPKSRYADTVLQAEDRIEIVHFIGGG